MDSKKKALLIGDFASKKKAKKIITLELKKLTGLTDYFVICSGTSNVHLEAIAEGIREGLRKKKIKPFGIEGNRFANWILMDYGEVIVHIFREEARNFYRIENLWGDAKKVRRKKSRGKREKS